MRDYVLKFCLEELTPSELKCIEKVVPIVDHRENDVWSSRDFSMYNWVVIADNGYYYHAVHTANAVKEGWDKAKDITSNVLEILRSE